MPHHFGVLIPSTNRTVETEYTRLLPEAYQPHYARVKSASIDGSPFSPPLDADVDYQSRMLGTAKVELVILIQSSASLFEDDYDGRMIPRISKEAGVPAFTSAMAIGEALKALGVRRIALVSPYSVPVNANAKRYFEGKFGLSIVAVEGFGATNAYEIGALGPENAREAFARIDRPEIEAFIVPGGNFPTMKSIAGWEAEFKKPVVTTNQAAIWAMAQRLGASERIAGLGRLLAEMPKG